ncbi:MAG: transglycosylase SLT domain-containing protein, partial [Thermostichus sp. DG02_2_bins_29]
IGLGQYSLTHPADNLYLGAWYLDYTHRTYQDNTLLALASYNGGPGNVARWLNRYGFADPDLFVEQIPFAETRGYVKSVFGNYWNYWQLYTQEGRTLVSQSL